MDRKGRVDFDASKVTYKVPTVHNLLVKTVKKGRGAPAIPAEVLAELRLAKDEAQTSHVIEFDGKPLRNIKRSFNTAVRNAGLGTDVTPHTLRHTFATWCEGMGIDANAVARAMGHKKASTTKDNYQHAQTEGARPATDAVASKIRLHSIKGGRG